MKDLIGSIPTVAAIVWLRYGERFRSPAGSLDMIQAHPNPNYGQLGRIALSSKPLVICLAGQAHRAGQHAETGRVVLSPDNRERSQADNDQETQGRTRHYTRYG